MLYVFYICIFLACVEELDGVNRNTQRDSDQSPTHIAVVSLSRAREENRIWDSDDEDNDLIPASRTKQAKLLWEYMTGLFKFVVKKLWLCLISDPDDRYLVTRSLSTSVAQLRYRAGGTWWPLRAMGSYLIWAVLAQRFAVIAASLFFSILSIIMILIVLALSKLFKFSSPDFPPPYISVIIAEAVVGGALNTKLAFHSLSVILERHALI
jgi:hypothetical protein